MRLNDTRSSHDLRDANARYYEYRRKMFTSDHNIKASQSCISHANDEDEAYILLCKLFQATNPVCGHRLICIKSRKILEIAFYRDPHY